MAATTGSAHAGAITWQTVQNVTGNVSDVITTGTLLSAISFSEGSDVTVNGVTFRHISSYSTSGSSQTLSFASTPDVSVTNVGAHTGTAQQPWAVNSAWNANYNTLLDRGAYSTSNSGRMTFTLSGLVSGQSYAVQFWTGYWNAQYPTSFSDGTNASGYLADGVGSILPQYVIGTFTASGTTETIYADGSSSSIALLDAMQLRTFDPPPPVPEPASGALLGIGLAGLIFARKRKQDQVSVDEN
jgi:hypothetical protein